MAQATLKTLRQQLWLYRPTPRLPGAPTTRMKYVQRTGYHLVTTGNLRRVPLPKSPHQEYSWLSELEKRQVDAELDLFADAFELALQTAGFPPHFSPLFVEGWSLCVGLQSRRIIALFFRGLDGMRRQQYMDLRNKQDADNMDPVEFARGMREQWGGEVVAVVVLGAPNGTDDTTRATRRGEATAEQLSATERSMSLGRLGDLTGMTHLEPQLRAFLGDHPDPDRSVFIMMSFEPSEQLEEVHQTIVDVLAERGLHGMRANRREYSTDLWSNVETYMVGCALGIAVFENMHQEGHNPNIALELGYMRAKRKRCLILKEKTLVTLPTDVVGSLYKPFDQFNITETVRTQVTQWIEVDLAL